MSTMNTFENFGDEVEMNYHGDGHVDIGIHCSTLPTDQFPSGIGMMAFSEVSARDPIFYRWHTHIEDIVQEFRDKKFPAYTRNDFALSGQLQVKEFKTIVDRNDAGTDFDVENILITYNEIAKLTHSRAAQIRYRRMNHIPYKYEITMANPLNIRKKVIVRIWLGLGKNFAYF